MSSVPYFASAAASSSASATITVSVNATAPDPAPEPDPDPAPSSAQPTGETIEFAGDVTEVGDGYFVVDGLHVNYDATSVMKYDDSQGSTPMVGDSVEGKADEYSDGSGLAIKAEFT